MKKFISIILCVLLVCVCFAGCKDNKQNETAGSIDVEYYAKLGRMPECEYSLGADAEEIKTKAEKHFNESEEAYYSLEEGEKSILIDTGDFKYYYEKEKKDKGISLIVNNNTAFGFELGAVSVEIENALSKFNSEKVTDLENDLFFVISASGNIEGRKYIFGDNAVIFVFSDNALIATAIYSLENWTI